MTIDLTPTELTLAEIYVITTTDNAVLFCTSHSENIIYDGDTYQAIPMSRGQISYHTNLQVDKVDISLGIVGVTVGDLSYSMFKIIRLGLLRNANVKIYLIDYVSLAEINLLFEGWITEGATYNKGIVTISVGSILDKLNDKFPKYIYSDKCNHQLYSTYCGLTKATYKVSSTIATSSTQLMIYSSVFAFSAPFA